VESRAFVKLMHEEIGQMQPFSAPSPMHLCGLHSTFDLPASGGIPAVQVRGLAHYTAGAAEGKQVKYVHLEGLHRNAGIKSPRQLNVLIATEEESKQASDVLARLTQVWSLMEYLGNTFRGLHQAAGTCVKVLCNAMHVGHTLILWTAR
jgi:hypothetical protein